MSIQLKNLHYEKMEHPWDVRIDRQSIYGNPYLIDGANTRDKVIELYRDYAFKRCKKDGDFAEAVLDLIRIYLHYGKLNLFCWCSPANCHGNILIELILKLLEEVELCQ